MNGSVFTALDWGDVFFLGEAALRTVQISVIAIIVGSLLGVLLGWTLAAGGWLVRLSTSGVLDVFRSVPLLIQLILFDSFVAIAGYPMQAFWSGTIVLSVYCAALVAMVARAGIENVGRDMQRASRSLGMSYLQTMRHVVWPIGLRTVFPSWIGVSLSIVKDSALVSAIGYIELLRASQILNTKTQESFKIMLLVGLFYFLISYPISRWGDRLERRWKK
ncbi:amino acid ABC transporter permease [Gymnodinialimonas sp. 2305UL16-5]|uniref:amino acid ABC transporter permease n=1 Tax=Gymnodinialimonas mytili TaxID=3126503 RepID=UPI0030A3AE29